MLYFNTLEKLDAMGMIGLAWVIFGGFLEPLWVIGLKKYSEKKSKLVLLITIILMYISPMCIAFGMQDGMSVGVAYSIWTGLGAVFSVAAGFFLFKEKMGRLKIIFIMMIIIGVVGLELSAVVM